MKAYILSEVGIEWYEILRLCRKLPRAIQCMEKLIDKKNKQLEKENNKYRHQSWFKLRQLYQQTMNGDFPYYDAMNERHFSHHKTWIWSAKDNHYQYQIEEWEMK